MVVFSIANVEPVPAKGACNGCAVPVSGAIGRGKSENRSR